jgi:predicted DNA-binding transcriptional regulator YafY
MPGDALPFHTPEAFVPEALWAPLPEIRRGLREQRKLAFRYTNEQGVTVGRTVRPLAVNFWGHAWTLCAWCELRDDFRHFRLDRMRDWHVLDAHFRPEPGKTLDDLTRLDEQQQHGRQR